MKNKKIKIAITIIVLTIIMCIIYISRTNAKYLENLSQKFITTISDKVCEIEVQASPTNSAQKNPYCIVTVKNYNDKKTTQIAMKFEVNVKSSDETQLPEYHWEDMNGNTLEQITGNFGLDKEEKQYKIIFNNVETADIEKNIEFEVVAEQI